MPMAIAPALAIAPVLAPPALEDEMQIDGAGFDSGSMDIDGSPRG
jgi:hypothetical protein